MATKVYYQDPDMEITDTFIRAKAGIFPIEGILSVEAKRPTLMIAVGAVLWAVFGFGVFFSPSASAGERALLIGFFGLYCLGLLGYLFMCPVFVRTASGVTQIGVPKFPSARSAIMQAFAEAKNATR